MAAVKKKVKNKKNVASKPTKKSHEKDLSVADGIPVHCACDDILKLEKITPYGRNANKHPDDQVLLLAKLIHGHGWRGPITISNQSGFVVRGHGRLAAAHKLEAASAPVDYQDYATPELENADRIADNRIQELSEWDKVLLKDELINLDSGVLGNMDLTGYEGPSLEDMMTAAPPAGSSLNNGGSDNPGDGSSSNQSQNGKEGRTRCVLGDLDMFINAEFYNELLEYMRNKREETGDDFPLILEEIIRRGMK